MPALGAALLRQSGKECSKSDSTFLLGLHRICESWSCQVIDAWICAPCVQLVLCPHKQLEQCRQAWLLFLQLTSRRRHCRHQCLAIRALVCSLCLFMSSVQAQRLTQGKVYSFDSKDTLNTASGQMLSRCKPHLGVHISHFNPLLNNLMVSMMFWAIMCIAWADALPGMRTGAETTRNEACEHRSVNTPDTDCSE